METAEVFSRQELDEFARAAGVRVRIAAETWATLIYQAEVDRTVGGRLRCVYRVRLPRELALRRREKTLVVGLVHETGAGTAQCHHVREVIIGLCATNTLEAERLAVLFAAAQVELERREVCGAAVRNLVPCVTRRIADWDLLPRLQ